MSTKRSSSIWEHFTVDSSNCTVAVCNVCDIKLSCGYLVPAGYHIYFPLLAG